MKPWLTLLTLLPAPLLAQGHGPSFALATPTLGKHGWSVDMGFMQRSGAGEYMIMNREMVSYGLTQDLQLSVSLPVPLRMPMGMPYTRATARMSANPDAEFALGWRFHRRGGSQIGSRFESTAWLGLDYPTDAVRAGIPTAPGGYIGLTTGYASRTFYFWIGGLYQRYLTPVGATADHPGDILLYSAALGYRPPVFQHDYPHADWRIFVEAVGERSAANIVAGRPAPNTGGHQLFVGPTLLGLYGSWGISGGPLFPVFRDLNGQQSADRFRLMINLSFWFF